MKRYELSVAARQDLDDIWLYIAQDSPDAADRWVAKLISAFERLAPVQILDIRAQISRRFPFSFSRWNPMQWSIRSMKNWFGSSQ